MEMDHYFLWKLCMIIKELNHKYLLKLLSQDSCNKVRSQDTKKSNKRGDPKVAEILWTSIVDEECPYLRNAQANAQKFQLKL